MDDPLQKCHSFTLLFFCKQNPKCWKYLWIKWHESSDSFKWNSSTISMTHHWRENSKKFIVPPKTDRHTKPCVNFTNILQAAFTRIPQKCKKAVKLSSFIALLGSARLKAACRMLVKLTPCQQNIRWMMNAFFQEAILQKIFTPKNYYISL